VLDLALGSKCGVPLRARVSDPSEAASVRVQLRAATLDSACECKHPTPHALPDMCGPIMIHSVSQPALSCLGL
jgi:hypothetical protein